MKHMPSDFKDLFIKIGKKKRNHTQKYQNGNQTG